MLKPDPAMPRIERHLDALAYRAAPNSPYTALVRELPSRHYAGHGVWMITLARVNLVGLRKLYAAGCAFSPEAIMALRALRDSPSGGLSGPEWGARLATGPDISPEVVPACRGLEATLDPSNSAGTGPENPGAKIARSSESGAQ